MELKREFELNRGFVYPSNIDLDIAQDEEPIGETNFVVGADWLADKYNEVFDKQLLWDDFNDFLDTYEPTEQGEEIYQLAVKENALIEDKGIVLYENN